MEKLGVFLRRVRENQGLSLRDVDHKTRISHTYLGMLERGERTNPTPEVLRKLSDVYGVDYIQLLRLAGHLDEDDLSILDEPERKFLVDFATTGAVSDIKKVVKIARMIQKGDL